jgi:predicted nucleic acid-binding protein
MPKALPLYKKYLPVIDIEIAPLPPPEDVEKLSGRTSDKDIPVLASALNSNVDYLVTGDKKDFTKLMGKGHYSFKILSPSEFLDIIIPKILKQQ